MEKRKSVLTAIAFLLMGVLALAGCKKAGGGGPGDDPVYEVQVIGGTGSGWYAAGATVKIFADTPPDDQMFINWTTTPDVAFVYSTEEDDEARFKMPGSNVTVTANFGYGYDAYSVTITEAGVGATGEGNWYQEGNTVTISAGQAPAGKEFDYWSSSTVITSWGAGGTGSPNTSFTMPGSDVALTVHWKDRVPGTYVVNITGSGSADKSSYQEGEEVTITAGTTVGRTFSGWTITPTVSFVDGTSASDSEAKFTMPDNDVNVTANFDGWVDYTIAKAGDIENGDITLPDSPVHYQDTITLTADPGEGYDLVRFVIINGEDVQYESPTGENTVSFSMPADNITVSAEFAKKKFSVTVIDGDGDGQFEWGTEVTVTAREPEEGYGFSSWTITGGVEVEYAAGSSGTGSPATFIMPKQNITLTPGFALKKYTITLDNQDTHGTVALDGVTDGKATHGDTVTITATPTAQDYNMAEIEISIGGEIVKISKISAGADNTYAPVSITLTGSMAADLTVKVTFKIFEGVVVSINPGGIPVFDGLQDSYLLVRGEPAHEITISTAYTGGVSDIQWYIDGDKADDKFVDTDTVSGDTLILDAADWKIGNHSFTVVFTIGGVQHSSNIISFEVTR